jgi:hypothetical protein
MPEFVSSTVGSEVEIIYFNDSTDKGQLLDIGEGWIKLAKAPDRKGHSDIFLIPATAVRLIRLFDAPENSSNQLLRPIGAIDE